MIDVAVNTQTEIKAFRACGLVPVFNNERTIQEVVTDIRAQSLPCIVINDGSDDDTRNIIERLAQSDDSIHLISFKKNQGKGAAVLAGLSRADELGYTHALQIDADGQHNIADVPKYLETAEQHPCKLIAGNPIFDAHAPAVRLWGRKLSIWLSWIETLSFDISDILFGMRVYPVSNCMRLIQQRSIGSRMEFDTDIAIKLCWQGVQVVNVDSKVSYPEDGVSHFRMFCDNLRLIGLHIRLLLEFPFHIPKLLRRRKERASEKQDWHKQQERGTIWSLRIAALLFRLVGRRIFYLLLYPIVAYFFITSSKSRLVSLEYLKKIYQHPEGKKTLGKQPNFKTVFLHFLEFGRTMIDRLAVWTGKIDLANVNWNNLDELLTLYDKRQGAVFISAHLGAIEVVRALSESIPKLTVKALMFTDHVNKFESVTRSVNPEVGLQIVAVEDINANTVIDLKNGIKQGEFIAMLGDRAAPGSQQRVRSLPFLGELADFPEGPWILASMLECPVFLVFCLRDDINSYSVYFEKVADRLKLPRAGREESLLNYMRSYTRHLAEYCFRAPLQWFNFFQFWHTNRSVADVEQRSISKDVV